MKITSITAQARDKNRVNVSVDGKYRFSLDIFQVGELGIRVGKEYSDAELLELETESQFGKLYTKALEYCMMRPRSIREVRDYLWKKTLTRKRLNSKTNKMVEIPGVSKTVAERVLARLIDKKYLDDEKFAMFWFENRFKQKGISQRRLEMELMKKGVDRDIIDKVSGMGVRSDQEELAKIVAKKKRRYPDEKKFIAYLARQGFSYDDIREALK